MCKDVYCKKCILKSSNPGIEIDENGLCNICDGKENKQMFKHFRQSSADYKRFKENVRKNKESRSYDCIVMFSGGKDSINIVEKMVNEEKLRVLAVTIDLPFETKKAKEHMQFVTDALDVHYITIKPPKHKYMELMKCIFHEEYKGKTLNLEGICKYKHLGPCIVCTCYITLLASFLAKHMNIPYVMYCADPGQIANLPIGLDKVVEGFRSMFDDEFINSVCQDKIECLDKEKTDWVPEIVYPYIAMPDYNGQKIIERLKSKNLYKINPQEGHCKLWALLNYNAMTRYNSPFYILDYASDVRSSEDAREQVLPMLEKFCELVIKTAKEGVTPEEDAQLKQLISFISDSEGSADYIYNNVHELQNYLKEFEL